MGLFGSGAEENARKEALKKLEDRRMGFALRMEKQGFWPEKMLFLSGAKGNFTALSKCGEKLAVIVSPILGTDEDYQMDYVNPSLFREEEVDERGEGLNGVFGFGKKGYWGWRFYFPRESGGEFEVEVLTNRSLYLETAYPKNPLLSTKRRRGDANVTWELMPIEARKLQKVHDLLAYGYLN